MKTITKAFLLMLALFVCSCGSGGGSNSDDEKADEIQAGINALFADIDHDLAAAAAEIGPLGVINDASREVLTATCLNRPYAIDCATIDSAGWLRLIEPAQYREDENTDISSQTGVQQMLVLHEPVLSDIFVSVEGMPALSIAYPVFSPGNSFLGSISMLAYANVLCGVAIEPLVNGTSYGVWVMQLDGLVLYADDPAEMGVNLLTDPYYQGFPELVALGRQIVAEPQGSGSYTFTVEETDEEIRKDVVWRTVSLYGKSWRVVVYRQAD